MVITGNVAPGDTAGHRLVFANPGRPDLFRILRRDALLITVITIRRS